jgi:hypothetical protein
MTKESKENKGINPPKPTKTNVDSVSEGMLFFKFLEGGRNGKDRSEGRAVVQRTDERRKIPPHYQGQKG